MSQLVPTILIGVGGIGSEIVDRVKAKVTQSGADDSFVFHIFDTNVSDLKNLKHLSANEVTQTSKGILVADYLNEMDKAGDFSYKEWFPHNSFEVTKRSLTEGAGQVRPISRLGLGAVLASGGFSKLTNAFNRIFTQNSSSLNFSPRVMVVSSITGGTGAGIFLQIGLLLRSILKERYGKNPLIRGTFLLSDIIVNSGALTDPNQIDNLRTNAYSCLKELDAFITANSGERDSNLQLELNYSPNQKKINGKYIVEELPYDFSILFDFENLNGDNLNFFNNYKSLVVESVFTDLMSPIGDTIYSQQDNRILDIIKEEGRNRYCGASVAKLVYPFEDIIELGALTKVVQDIDTEWMMVDDLINEEVKAQKAAVKARLSAPEVDKVTRFIELLKVEYEKTTPNPFFNQIYKSTHVSLADNFGEAVLGESFAAEFIKAIKEEGERLIGKNSELGYLKAAIEGIDSDEFKKKTLALRAIEDKEGLLQQYKKKVNEFIPSAANQLYREITIKDQNKDSRFSDTPHTLNYWFLKGDGMHPLAVRLLLNQIIDVLRTQLQGGMNYGDSDAGSSSRGLTTTNVELNKRIEDYKNIYDDQETEDLVENATDRVEDILAKKFSWFSNDLKEFAEEYDAASSSQYDVLNQYVASKFLETIFERLKKDVEQLSDMWENYFRALDEVAYELAKKRNELYTIHAEGNPTIRYVLATKEHKEALLSGSLYQLSNTLPPDVSKGLYINQFDRWLKKLEGKKVKETGQEIRSLVESDMVRSYADLLKAMPALDLDIIQACRKQAEFDGVDDDDIDNNVAEQIEIVDRICVPFIKPSGLDNIAANSIDVWGIADSIEGKLKSRDLQAIFAQGSTIANPFFSSKEIVRSKTVFGISASKLPKFAKGGVYQLAYDKRIEMLNGNVISYELGKPYRTVTPHLDTRWHIPSAMPNIGENINESFALSLKATIAGLALGQITHIKDVDEFYWVINKNGNSEKLTSATSNALTKGDFFSLLTGVWQDSTLTSSVLNTFEQARQADISKFPRDISQHAFIKGLNTVLYRYEAAQLNILDIVYQLADRQPKGEYYEKKTYEFLDAVVKLIKEYISDFSNDIAGDDNALAKAVKNILTPFLGSDYQKNNSAELENGYKSILKAKISDLVK